MRQINFTFQSKETGLDDLALGIFGDLPWEAKCVIIEESVLVKRAYAKRWVGSTLHEIDITDIVENDKDLKELILKQYRDELEAELNERGEAV